MNKYFFISLFIPYAHRPSQRMIRNIAIINSYPGSIKIDVVSPQSRVKSVLRFCAFIYLYVLEYVH
jgi:hypothetical protein